MDKVIDKILEQVECIDFEEVSELHNDYCGGEITCVMPNTWEDENGTRYSLAQVIDKFIEPALEDMTEEELNEVAVVVGV